MTDLRKAAEQALEALEANLGKWAAKTAAVEALRQALAEDALKTVADIDHSIGLFVDSPSVDAVNISQGRVDETAKHKREWVGLTDADIAKAMHGNVEGSNMLPYQFARAIEQALKEKNYGSSNT